MREFKLRRTSRLALIDVISGRIAFHKSAQRGGLDRPVVEIVCVLAVVCVGIDAVGMVDEKASKFQRIIFLELLQHRRISLLSNCRAVYLSLRLNLAHGLSGLVKKRCIVVSLSVRLVPDFPFIYNVAISRDNRFDIPQPRGKRFGIVRDLPHAQFAASAQLATTTAQSAARTGSRKASAMASFARFIVFMHLFYQKPVMRTIPFAQNSERLKRSSHTSLSAP